MNFKLVNCFSDAHLVLLRNHPAPRIVQAVSDYAKSLNTAIGYSVLGEENPSQELIGIAKICNELVKITDSLKEKK